jgi:hypothetical protein
VAERKELMRKYGNYKYYSYGNHLYQINGWRFKRIMEEDETHLSAIVNDAPPVPWKSYDCLMEYINYHCEVIEMPPAAQGVA